MHALISFQKENIENKIFFHNVLNGKYNVYHTTNVIHVPRKYCILLS